MNILDALSALAYPACPIESLTGYKMTTTFWDDFWIADRFGEAAIRDTYRRAFREWKKNPVYIAEMVIVLNHIGWYKYDNGMQSRSRVYFELWEKLHSWARDTYRGDDFRTYWQITD